MNGEPVSFIFQIKLKSDANKTINKNVLTALL